MGLNIAMGIYRWGDCEFFWQILNSSGKSLGGMEVYSWEKYKWTLEDVMNTHTHILYTFIIYVYHGNLDEV